MKLTIENYFDKVSDYLDIINANANLVAGHDFVVKATKNGKDFTAYEKSAGIKETIDLYFEKLATLKAKEKKPVTKKAAPKKASTGNKKAPAKTKTTAPVPKQKHTAKATRKPADEVGVEAEKVEHISSDIALVKRYINLHEKQKTYEQVLAIWRAFNKAIVERKVTRESPYKTEIATMNSSLTAALEAAKATGSLHLVIPAGKLKTYRGIADSVEKSVGVAIMLEFINISGKFAMSERADKLSKRIERAIGTGKLDGDRYLKEIKKAQLALSAYVNKETDVVSLNNYGLSGIGELAVFGCPCQNGISGFTRSQNAVVLKLLAEKVKNLTDCELDRAFSDTVAPSLCKSITHKLIETRQLTMALLRNPAKVSGGLALNGSGSHKGYDLDTEIMDMRLRNAGAKAASAKVVKHPGLSGVPGALPPGPVEEVKIMSARELMNQKFKTMGLQGKYRKLIGDPEPGFSAMIYGKPKQGKSTLAIDFAKELTKHGRVLYCAFEEGHGYTLQDKVKRNNADVPGLDFANKLPHNLSMYQYVFVDSVSDAGLDEQAFKNLIRTNKPQTSILGVFHATKGGTFRGGQTYAHDVDVLIKVEDGVAHSQGRYAAPGQINIAAILPPQQRLAA